MEKQSGLIRDKQVCNGHCSKNIKQKPNPELETAQMTEIQSKNFSVIRLVTAFYYR